jgi:hypothetical protein
VPARGAWGVCLRVTIRVGLAAVLTVWASSVRAGQVVQVPLDGVLTARPVTTLNGSTLVTWTDGIDRDDAFITTAAAKSLGQSGPALPDDGKFAADGRHPEVVLHFSNAAPATSGQALVLEGVGTFHASIPPAIYSSLFLFLTSSYGDSPLTVTFTYADKKTSTVSFTLPDWGTGAPLPTSPPIFFNLITGLHKWTRQNAAVDTPSHGVIGVELAPTTDAVLTDLRIDKSGAAQELVFWGVTGVATGDGTDAGARDASGDAGDVDVGGSARDASSGADLPVVVSPPLDAAGERAVSESDAAASEVAAPPVVMGGQGATRSAGGAGCEIADVSSQRRVGLQGLFVFVSMLTVSAARLRRPR